MKGVYVCPLEFVTKCMSFINFPQNTVPLRKRKKISLIWCEDIKHFLLSTSKGSNRERISECAKRWRGLANGPSYHEGTRVLKQAWLRIYAVPLLRSPWKYVYHLSLLSCALLGRVLGKLQSDKASFSPNPGVTLIRC